MKTLQPLTIEKLLNKRYAAPAKSMISNKIRVMQYLNWNLANLLRIDILPTRKWGLEVSKAKIKLTEDGFPELAAMLPNGLDECSVQTFYLYQQYLKNTFKNYVPSKPLLSVLQKIDVDMKASYLQKGTRGYFELSHADLRGPAHWSPQPMENFLFEVGDEALMISVHFKNDISPTSFFVPLGLEENLSDVLRRLNFTVIQRDASGKAKGVPQKIQEEDIGNLKVLFNLIIYVTNPNEEFISCVNEFSPNNKIAQIEKLDYTSRPFIRLGFDAEFLRLITTESFDVRSHWRWQACGAGWQQRRLTFVKAHQRNLSRIKGEGDGV